MRLPEGCPSVRGDELQQLLGLPGVARVEQGLGVKAGRLERVGVIEAATVSRQVPGMLQQLSCVAGLTLFPKHPPRSARAARVRGWWGPRMRLASAAADW